MKKILLLSIFSIIICKSYSKDPDTDSLLHELSIEKADTSRLKTLLVLLDTYTVVSPDSVLHYLPFAFNLVQKLADKKSEARLYFYASISYSALGNLSKAVDADLKALHFAEQTDDLNVQANILLTLGEYFYQSKDYSTALTYWRNALAIYERYRDRDFEMFTINFIASNYLETGKLDSAEYYNQKAFRIWDDFHKKNRQSYGFIKPNMLNTRAKLETQKKNFNSAIKDLEEAILISGKMKGVLKRSYLQLGKVFYKMNQADSAAAYAEQSLSLADSIKQFSEMADAAKLLAQIYNQKDPRQAIFYQEKALAAYDSAIQQMKSSAVKNLIGFDEQQQKYELKAATAAYENKVRQYALLSGLAVLLLIAFILYRNNNQKQKSNKILQQTLLNLKSTQSQLIHSEKMASLGELTAGIAHEIQNPLNFVNNFSEVNNELIEELKGEWSMVNGEKKEVGEELINDIQQNTEKILHHGKRADAIVKSMLEHSRSSTGIKEPTDINKLVGEYLGLSYHGLRAKDKNFNAETKTDFDESIGKINIVAQDIGRVLLNLFNNAFYAVREKQKAIANKENTIKNISYQPTVWVNTQKEKDRVTITVKDNGSGIPEKIKEKIFQPFFTTKPTGSGTGLGLSLSYDIIKAHSGEIKVESEEGQGSEFIIFLPIKPVS
jgi:signal transduction histidine kinase